MRYRKAKKLLLSAKTPRVKSALARVSTKQRERVARAGSIRSARRRRRWRLRSNARWLKAWKRRPAPVSSAASEIWTMFSGELRRQTQIAMLLDAESTVVKYKAMP